MNFVQMANINTLNALASDQRIPDLLKIAVRGNRLLYTLLILEIVLVELLLERKVALQSIHSGRQILRLALEVVQELLIYRYFVRRERATLHPIAHERTLNVLLEGRVKDILWRLDLLVHIPCR